MKMEILRKCASITQLTPIRAWPHQSSQCLIIQLFVLLRLVGSSLRHGLFVGGPVSTWRRVPHTTHEWFRVPCLCSLISHSSNLWLKAPQDRRSVALPLLRSAAAYFCLYGSSSQQVTVSGKVIPLLFHMISLSLRPSQASSMDPPPHLPRQFKDAGRGCGGLMVGAQGHRGDESSSEAVERRPGPPWRVETSWVRTSPPPLHNNCHGGG